MKKNKPIRYLLAALFIVAMTFIAIKIVIPKIGGNDVLTLQEQLEGEHIAIPLREDVSLISRGFDFTLGKQETIEKINAEDEVFEFQVQRKGEMMGDLEIVIREIDNGDQYVFSRFKRLTEEDVKIPLTLLFEGQKDYTYHQFDEELDQEHDRVFGIDHTSNVKGLYEMDHYQLFLSQNYISTEETLTYENGQESVLRELVNEDKNIAVDVKKGNLVYTVELRTTGNEQFSENWFLLSEEPLFSTDTKRNEYKNNTNHEFISSRKWLTSTGPYTKLPWSVEPSTKLAYGRNLVVVQGLPFVKSYEKSPERLYYDMIVNSVNYVWDFKEDTDLWETEYTSTWLKNDYGIIAPYTDTRHNENVALFLSRAGDILDNPTLKEHYLLYADFLSMQEEIGNILSTENGYYILDYYSEVQTKKTHVSLNHALGEMNYLFNAYKQTNNEDYLQVALKIKQAVEDQGLEWINPENGDLWYQINGDYSFEGKDYDTLTLTDLLVSINYYEEFDLLYSDIYDKLIASKVAYIIENEIEINKALHRQLLDIGFTEELKDYEHVLNLVA